MKNSVKEDNVYILGDFDETISSEVIPEMVSMINRKSKEKNPTIDIYINSYGGLFSELLGMISMIQIAKSRGIKVNTHVIGTACSCGSMLAIHGDHRTMTRNGTNMMHLGRVGAVSTTIEQQDRNNKRINAHFNMIVKWYKEHSKLSVKMIKDFMKDDYKTLSAEECLKYGLCDEII